ALRRRDARGRRGRRARTRSHGDWRRRLRRGAHAVRAAGHRQPPLDRGRRDARVARGPRAPRRSGPRRDRGRVRTARTPLIAGNWKMYKTEADAEEYIQALLPRLGAVAGVDVAICVPFTDLRAMVDSARGSRVEVYAQNMHHEPEGAFTGEVSAAM